MFGQSVWEWTDGKNQEIEKNCVDRASSGAHWYREDKQSVLVSSFDKNVGCFDCQVRVFYVC